MLVLSRHQEIPGFPGYAAGVDGSIWSRRRSSIALSCHKWSLLKPDTNRSGHLAYVLYRNGKPHHRFGHQLVLITFVGPCPDGMECCHNNGNPADNRRSNLRWDSRKANAEDCIRHGRRPKGSAHGRAKVAEGDIPEIRRLAASGRTRADIGRAYGISAHQVMRIVRGDQWKHVG